MSVRLHIIVFVALCACSTATNHFNGQLLWSTTQGYKTQAALWSAYGSDSKSTSGTPRPLLGNFVNGPRGLYTAQNPDGKMAFFWTEGEYIIKGWLAGMTAPTIVVNETKFFVHDDQKPPPGIVYIGWITSVALDGSQLFYTANNTIRSCAMDWTSFTCGAPATYISIANTSVQSLVLEPATGTDATRHMYFAIEPAGKDYGEIVRVPMTPATNPTVELLVNNTQSGTLPVLALDTTQQELVYGNALGIYAVDLSSPHFNVTELASASGVVLGLQLVAATSHTPRFAYYAFNTGAGRTAGIGRARLDVNASQDNTQRVYVPDDANLFGLASLGVSVSSSGAQTVQMWSIFEQGRNLLGPLYLLQNVTMHSPPLDPHNTSLPNVTVTATSIIDNDMAGIRFPQLNTATGDVYWIDSSNTKILTANVLNPPVYFASSRRVLNEWPPQYNGGSAAMFDLALDAAGGNLYWQEKVRTVNGAIYNGLNLVTMKVDGSGYRVLAGTGGRSVDSFGQTFTVNPANGDVLYIGANARGTFRGVVYMYKAATKSISLVVNSTTGMDFIVADWKREIMFFGPQLTSEVRLMSASFNGTIIKQWNASRVGSTFYLTLDTVNKRIHSQDTFLGTYAFRSMDYDGANNRTDWNNWIKAGSAQPVFPSFHLLPGASEMLVQQSNYANTVTFRSKLNGTDQQILPFSPFDTVDRLAVDPTNPDVVWYVCFHNGAWGNFKISEAASDGVATPFNIFSLRNLSWSFSASFFDWPNRKIYAFALSACCRKQPPFDYVTLYEADIDGGAPPTKLFDLPATGPFRFMSADNVVIDTNTGILYTSISAGEFPGGQSDTVVSITLQAAQAGNWSNYTVIVPPTNISNYVQGILPDFANGYLYMGISCGDVCTYPSQHYPYITRCKLDGSGLETLLVAKEAMRSKDNSYFWSSLFFSTDGSKLYGVIPINSGTGMYEITLSSKATTMHITNIGGPMALLPSSEYVAATARQSRNNGGYTVLFKGSFAPPYNATGNEPALLVEHQISNLRVNWEATPPFAYYRASFITNSSQLVVCWLNGTGKQVITVPHMAGAVQKLQMQAVQVHGGPSVADSTVWWAGFDFMNAKLDGSRPNILFRFKYGFLGLQWHDEDQTLSWLTNARVYRSSPSKAAQAPWVDVDPFISSRQPNSPNNFRELHRMQVEGQNIYILYGMSQLFGGVAMQVGTDYSKSKLLALPTNGINSFFVDQNGGALYTGNTSHIARVSLQNAIDGAVQPSDVVVLEQGLPEPVSNLLLGSSTAPQPNPNPNHHHGTGSGNHKDLIVGVAVAAGVVLLALVAFGVYRRKERGGFSDTTMDEYTPLF